MAEGLAVPIRVEALLLSATDAHRVRFASPTADFTLLSPTTPYLGQQVVSAPFDAGSGALGAGVHLHWNLPRALRVASQDSEGNAAAPLAPNRWMVTRISQVNTTDVVYDSWILESDYVSPASAPPNNGSPTATIPLAPAHASDPAYAYMGRVYDGANWASDGNQGTYQAPFTGMGYGVPNFAGYYPNCRNVFGFWDQNPTQRTAGDGWVSYVVTGWYQNGTGDPAAAPPAGWQYSGASEAPSYSICWGAVSGVNFSTNPSYSYIPDYNVDIAPNISIGNSPVEALSAMIASMTDQPEAESLLNALQLGLLKQLGQADGVAGIDEGIFNHAFESTQYGQRWDIVPTPQAGMEALRKDIDPARAESTGAQLNQLNAMQQQLESCAAESASLQGQIFADWTKLMLTEHQPSIGGPDPNQINQYLNTEITQYNTLAAQLASQQQSIDDLASQIRAQLPPSLELTTLSPPHFHRPSDPAVLLLGNGIPGLPPDNAATISCVPVSALLSSIQLSAGLVPGSAPCAVPVSALPSSDVWPTLPLAALGQLVQTALMLDPNMSPVIAQAAAAQGGPANPAVLDGAAAATAISEAQTQYLASGTPSNGIAFSGSVPQTSIAFLCWAGEPWHPQALSWEFQFNAVLTQSSYPSDFILENFQLTGGALNFSYPSASFSGPVQKYQGGVMLSGGATTSLRAQLAQYLSHEPDSELSQIVDELGKYPMLSQSLAGFNSSLVMLEPMLQLPILDPNALTAAFASRAKQVAAAVGSQNQNTPLTSYAYNPIRAGQIRITQLRLIDEFGRVGDVNLQQLVVANTIPTGAGMPPPLLPPLRLAQNSQLLFQWLSASDSSTPSSSLPSSSPICGWVVPNHVDGSLMLYGASGAPVGSFLPTGTGGILWQAAPGTLFPGAPLQDCLAGQNSVLAGFANSIAQADAAYLNALIGTFDRAQAAMAPSNYAQHIGAAVLIGAPLALVQSAIEMRLLGLPQPNQSFNALVSDMRVNNPVLRTVSGFPEILFPVALGNPGRVNDGLAGFFPQNSSGTDFSTFYSGSADGDSSRIVAPAQGTITVSPATSSPPAKVTMLVDPRGAVQARNGISPVQSLVVPPDMAAHGLAHMSFTFLASPVLQAPATLQAPGQKAANALSGLAPFPPGAGSNVSLSGAAGRGLPLPTPAEADGDWRMVTYGGGKTWRDMRPVSWDTEATLQNPSRIVEGWLKLTPKTEDRSGHANTSK